jgi:hypothetical protein
MGVSVTPRPLVTPWEWTLGTHWTGGRVGHKGGLDREAGGKTLLLLPVIEHRLCGRPVRSQTLH